MKLMLAEDEPGLSRALTAILQHSDYEVDTALDGLTALEYLLANDYDTAILDIMMPGMDGIEVLNLNPRHDSHNDLALAYAKEHHLIMTAGSDCHRPGDQGTTGILSDTLPEDSFDLADLLRSGNYTIIRPECTED